MKSSFAVLLLSFFLIPVFAQESLEPVTVPEETMQKLRIHTFKPIVPPDAETLTPATVALRATINQAGGVENVEAVSGHPMLVRLASEAVKQWKYRRYEVNGIPRAVETTIHVEFTNESDPKTETPVPRAESPVLVTPDDVPAQLVYRAAPIYPPLARQARIQGTVMVRITISQLGEVRDVQLITGHPMLAPAAVDAIKKWRYLPYEVDGRTVEVETDVQVIFTLAGG